MNKQQGTTLIEILVSAFILSLGVLALTSMQVKSTASIMEAKMNMQVSHEAFRLGQNILTNPNFTANRRDYSHYNGQTCNYKNLKNEATQYTTKLDFNKNEIVSKHIFDFCSGITASTQNAEPRVIILVCQDDTFTTDTSYNKDFKCGSGGDQTILKVSWGLDDASFENTYQLLLPQE